MESLPALPNLPVCSAFAVEESRVVVSLIRSDGGSRSGNSNYVLIRGQGEGQGVVKMEAGGRLAFEELGARDLQGERFIRRYHEYNDSVVCTFESADYAGYYIWANTEEANDFTVFGMQTKYLDKAYWKVLPYASVTRSTWHFGRMSADNPWQCLKYWGDSRYRKTNLKESLFLAAEGTGSSAKFTLKSANQLGNENGSFSIR